MFLLNVDPDCERFGEEIALNIGRSRFPVTLFTRAERVADPQAPGGYFLDEGPSRVFPFDPYGEYNTLVFEERNESDSNGNGVLDPDEDLDRDGRLDVANFLDPQACAGFIAGIGASTALWPAMVLIMLTSISSIPLRYRSPPRSRMT